MQEINRKIIDYISSEKVKYFLILLVFAFIFFSYIVEKINVCKELDRFYSNEIEGIVIDKIGRSGNFSRKIRIKTMSQFIDIREIPNFDKIHINDSIKKKENSYCIEILKKEHHYKQKIIINIKCPSLVIF